VTQVGFAVLDKVVFVPSTYREVVSVVVVVSVAFPRAKSSSFQPFLPREYADHFLLSIACGSNQHPPCNVVLIEVHLPVCKMIK